MRTSSLPQIILCATIVLLVGCSPQAPVIVGPTSTAIPIIEVTSFPSTLKIDDIDLEFSSYKVDQQYLTITICFAPPAKRLWVFDDTVFSINTGIIEESWISTNAKTGRADGFSCGDIAYPIDLIPDTGKAKLSIGQLRTDVDCNKAQKNLDEAKTGIVITCDPNRVNTTWGFAILKKPVFTSDGEAFFKVQEAFSDTLQVNWRFSFFVEKP